MRFFILLLASITLASQISSVAFAEDSCDFTTEVDCSNPMFVKHVLPLLANHYDDLFSRYCVKHDYCYRYGFKTYGLSKSYCDNQFCDSLKKECEGNTLKDYLTFGATKATCISASNAYCLAVKQFGDDAFKGKDGRECHYDKTNENAHVRAIGSDGRIGAVKHRYLWSSGWTVVRPYQIEDQDFLMLLKNTTGLVHLHKPLTNGAVGRKIGYDDFGDPQTKFKLTTLEDWFNGGFTIVEFYRVGTKPFVFLMRTEDGLVKVREMDSDGTLGKLVRQYNWSSGYSDAKVYSVGGRTYIFLLKTESGRAKVLSINADGTPGALVEEYDWSGDWTTAETYTVGQKQYLFLLKEKNGTAQVREIDPEGRIGKVVDKYDWSSGWSTATFYEVNGKPYVLLLKRKNGTAAVYSVEENGELGNKIESYNWSDGYTNAAVFSVGGTPFVLLIKAWAGGKS